MSEKIRKSKFYRRKMLTKLNKPKKLSSRSGAFIGAEASSDLRIAVRFSQAFKVLYNSDKYQDEIVMPALFLVRQFLELGLKYNIRQLAPHSKSQNLIIKAVKNTFFSNKRGE